MKLNVKRLSAITVVYFIVFTVCAVAVDRKFQIKKPDQPSSMEKTTSTQFHGIRQGFDMRVWMGNMSCMGENYSGTSTTPDGFGLEYPRGSQIEHLFGAGPWIGALVDTATSGPPRIVKAVTTGYEGWAQNPLFEMHGNPDGRDSFFITTNVPNGRNRRGYDDDGDGKIDEDELNGVDDDGDGLIDEDYGAVSEHDAYVAYSDLNGDPNPIPSLNPPLGIKVWQRSFAWQTAVKEPILPIEYYYINVGTRVLDSVYVGFFADGDVGPKYHNAFYQDNYSAYLKDVRTAYIHNPQDRPSTPIGFTVLGTPKPLDSLRYTFHWFPGPLTPPTKRAKYDLMTSGRIDPDEYPALSDTRFFFSFGPFPEVKPNDTLKVVVALVSGQGVLQGPNNLHDNAAKALELYSRGFTTPPPPIGAPLRVTLEGTDRVKLDWKWRPGDPRCNPIEVWDDSNKFVGALPDSNWRRRNPELRCDPSGTGGKSGGRTFEGFRVWRSEAPIPAAGTFALLAQYDVYDGLTLADKGGHIEDPDIDSSVTTLKGYSFIDSNLVRGRKYTYAVTTFTLPGVTVTQIPGPNGVTYDTLTSPAVESAQTENQTTIVIPFSPSKAFGEVKVVPNPYRTDADYTFESGGPEGLGRIWSENQRVIWFIHLPTTCVIRIFSLSGDLVATLHHDDGTRQQPNAVDPQNPKPVGQEEWHLLSESGRAVASGVYVFTVESDFGRQIGKFVIIR